MACSSSSSHEKPPAVLEKTQHQEDTTAVQQPDQPAAIKPNPNGIPRPALPSSVDSSFAAFWGLFKKAQKLNDMKSITPFVQFPFDEDGGPWTSEQFIKSFQLVADTRALIKNGKPQKINHSEYRLNGENAGLIFKKTKAGAWKWVSIHYAH